MDLDIFKGWYHVCFDGPGELPEETARDIADRLPHGSGLDDDWLITVHRNGNLTATTEFHLMDENGFYSGWQGVRAHLSPDPKRPGKWVVGRVTAGRDDRALTLGLADMLADLLHFAFSV